MINVESCLHSGQACIPWHVQSVCHLPNTNTNTVICMNYDIYLKAPSTSSGGPTYSKNIPSFPIVVHFLVASIIVPYTSSGKFFIMIHLSTSSFAARFSLKNFAEKCFACSRISSPGNGTCVALYRLNIPVTACVDCPAKQKNSPFLWKCLNTSSQT